MNKLRLNIASKVTVAFSILIFASVLLVGYLVFTGSNRLIINSSEKRLEHTAQIISLRTNTYLQGITADLEFLIKNPSIEGLIRAAENDQIDPQTGFSYQQWDNQLAEIFKSLLASRPAYFQVRLIGKENDGFELIRVDRSNNIISRVEADQLQPKGDREYYQETIGLNNDEIYLSDINLNQEFGRINIPIIPTIRVSAPIFDNSGQPFGIVIININLTGLFSTLQDLADPSMLVYLSNQNGDYLLHPDPNRMFGFEMGKNFKIQKEFPSGIEIIDGNQKKLQTEENEAETQVPHLIYLQKLSVYDDQRFLVLGVASPIQSLLVGSRKLHRQSILITFIISIIGLFLAWIFGRTLINPLQKITTAISEFGAGKRNFVFSSNRNDEIGVLSRSFNQMADQIQQQLKALAEKEQYIRSIIDSTQEAILIFDQDLKIIRVNPAALRMFDLAENELKGKHLINIIESENDNVNPLQGDSLLKRSLHGFETTVKLKSGRQLVVLVSMSSFQAGNEKNHTALLYDISARKKYETELVNAKKAAEKANKIKDEFLSVMSHEIRTPLNGVIGMTRLLKQNNQDPKLEPILNTLQFSTDNLLSLINDILDFSKIQAGKVELEEKPVHLRSLLENVVQAHMATAKEKRLELILSIDPLVPEYLLSDQVRLYQIINNLLSNALKFTDQGKVELIVTGVSANRLEIRVSDTGIGIPADRIESIFEYFTQGSSETTRKYGGSGLGLTITKNLVKLMDGQVTLHSKPGKGSVFTISIPYKIPEKQPLPQEMNSYLQENDLSGLKVIYFEDVEYNQYIVENYLEKIGIKTDSAFSGREGLKMMKSRSYDLVLMDVNMPEMDGYEAARQIRNLDQKIPIVALTAMVSEQARAQVISAGMNDLVTKPVDPDILIETISKLIGKLPVESEQLYLNLENFAEVYDHDEVKIEKAIGLLIQEILKIRNKLKFAEENKNEDVIREIHHRLRPHIQILDLKKIDLTLVQLKAELSNYDEPHQIKPHFMMLNHLFDQLINNLEQKLAEIKI